MSDERWAMSVERLKDGNMNSRGLLSPRFYDYKIMASERRGTATLAARSRLCRRHFFILSLFHGFKNPRLFALWASRLDRRF